MKGILHAVLESKTGSWILLTLGIVVLLFIVLVVCARLFGGKSKPAISGGRSLPAGDFSDAQALLIGTVVALVLIGLGYGGLYAISSKEESEQFDQYLRDREKINVALALAASPVGLDGNKFDFPSTGWSRQDRVNYIREKRPPFVKLSQVKMSGYDSTHKYILTQDCVFSYDSGTEADRIRLVVDLNFAVAAAIQIKVDGSATDLRANPTLREFLPELAILKKMSEGKEVSIVTTHYFGGNGEPHAAKRNIEFPSINLTDEQRTDLKDFAKFILELREQSLRAAQAADRRQFP